MVKGRYVQPLFGVELAYLPMSESVYGKPTCEDSIESRLAEQEDPRQHPGLPRLIY